MKICATCKETKTAYDFRKDSNRIDGLQSSCKICVSLRDKSAYTKKYGEKSRKRVSERVAANRLIITTLKRSLGCKLCPENEPVCLEFHHLDPTKKDIGIANYMATNISKILQEIEKCVCLCSNCHKKVHAGLLIV